VASTACAGCDLDLFLLDDQVRQRHRLAELWAPLEKAVGTSKDTTLGMVRIAVFLPPVRRAPGPRLRRRSEADRASLLHERRGDDLQARDILTRRPTRSPSARIEVAAEPMSERPS
jgi:hypothetical protein